jgi:hypothetical protein
MTWPRKLILLMLGLRLWGQVQPLSPAHAAEQATVAALLSSSEPGQLAWGVQLAANYQQKQFIPAIISLLKFGNADGQLSAFDALIRLSADVPEQSLASFLNDRETLEPTIVLLARDPKAHAAFLMSALEQPLSNEHWVAVNSFVATAPPSGYASRLLGKWSIKATITVSEAGSGVGGGVGGTACGEIGLGFKPGFPVIPHYNIYEGLHPGATLIAAGPHPISYLRQDIPRSCSSSTDRDDYRLDYLRYMAHIDPQTPEGRLPFAPAVGWAGSENYRSKASAYLESLRAFVKHLRSRLTQAGVLTASETPLGPVLEIEVKDERASRSVPLPAIDWHL